MIMNKLKSNDYSNTKVEVHIKGKNIFLATSLNLVISIFQLFGGLFSNSLALLTDALHNFSDAINVTLYYLAEKINLRNAQETKTTNLKWIEFSASILKSIIMLSICCFLFFEAVQRFEHPQPVKGVLMVLIASISLVANVMAVKLLKKESQKSMHIKSAYLHLLTDTFSSLAIIIAGTMIFYFHIYWLDSIVTFLIGAYIFKEAFNAIVYAYHIANNSKSIQISMKEIKSSI